MKIEIDDQTANNLIELLQLIAGTGKEVVLNTYYEDKRKGYEERQILEQDEIAEYATGNKKLNKLQTIEEVTISDLIEESLEDLLMQIQDAQRNSLCGKEAN